jgi:hypothetical protein
MDTHVSKCKNDKKKKDQDGIGGGDSYSGP